MITKYHIIKESHIDTELLPSSKQILQVAKGFEGSTHRDLRDFGSPFNGYQKFKNGIEYWVLPYYSVPSLEVVREDEGGVFSQTLSLDELSSFGWDIEDLE